MIKEGLPEEEMSQPANSLGRSRITPLCTQPGAEDLERVVVECVAVTHDWANGASLEHTIGTNELPLAPR